MNRRDPHAYSWRHDNWLLGSVLLAAFALGALAHFLAFNPEQPDCTEWCKFLRDRGRP